MDAKKLEISSSRIDAIDGLRAVAIVAVIVYHLQASTLPGGYTGVDVFFVISGFVVCRSLLKSVDAPFVRYLTQFLARRLLRIYPPLLVMLVTTAGIYKAFTPPAGLGYTTMPTGFYALFGLSNFYLAKTNDTYFGRSFDFNPFVHTWSLGVEEQFYFLFPWILYLAFRCRSSQFAVGKKFGIGMLLVLSAASLVWSYDRAIADPVNAFYMLPSRFWELGFGVVLALGLDSLKSARKKGGLSSNALNVVGVLGLFLIGFGYLKESPANFSVAAVLIPVVGVALCIGSIAGSNEATWVSRILGIPLIAWIGRLSYSLYLWHWPVIVMQRWTIGIEGPGMIAIACVVMFLLALASYYLVEGLSRRCHAWIDTDLSIALGRSRSATNATEFALRIPTSWAVVAIGLLSIFGCGFFIKRVQQSRRIPQSVVAIDTWDNPWSIKSPGISPLGFSQGEAERVWSDRRLFVVGDSHAEAYAELLSILRRDKGVTVYLNAQGGVRIGSLVRRQAPADVERQLRFLDELREHSRPGDVVFLPSLRVQRLSNQDYLIPDDQRLPEGPGTLLEEERRVAVEEGAKLISQIKGLGVHVVIEAPKPLFRTPPFRVADRFNRMNPIGRGGLTMEREFLLRHRASAMK